MVKHPTESSQPPNALAVKERTAADLLDVSESTMRRWRRAGKGPRAIRISRLIRYRVEDLERFLGTEREKQ